MFLIKTEGISKTLTTYCLNLVTPEKAYQKELQAFKLRSLNRKKNNFKKIFFRKINHMLDRFLEQNSQFHSYIGKGFSSNKLFTSGIPWRNFNQILERNSLWISKKGIHFEFQKSVRGFLVESWKLFFFLKTGFRLVRDSIRMPGEGALERFFSFFYYFIFYFFLTWITLWKVNFKIWTTLWKMNFKIWMKICWILGWIRIKKMDHFLWNQLYEDSS